MRRDAIKRALRGTGPRIWPSRHCHSWWLNGVWRLMIGLRPARAAGSCREGLAMGLLNRLRAFAVLALIAVSVSACGYNVIPTKQEAANAAWAEVQNQYQRRADLVPNLVATVQGFAKQEKDVFVQVTEARAKATSIHLDANDLTDPAKVKRCRMRKTRCRAPSGDCWRSAKTIRSSNRTRTSSPCNPSSRGPKTASPSPGATTSPRCRTSTRR